MLIIMLRYKLNRKAKVILEDFRTREETRLLSKERAPRSSHKWDEFKSIKNRRTNFFEKIKIKVLPFGFLEANYITVTLHNTVPYCIPLLIRVYQSLPLLHSNTKYSKILQPFKQKIKREGTKSKPSYVKLHLRH